MITYGDALAFCVQRNAVFRFVHRHARGEFLAANDSIPGNLALEMAITIQGKTVMGHMPLDASKEPSSAVALALTGCVEWFTKREGQALITGANGNRGGESNA